MNIQRVSASNHSISFKQANVNIMAFSDTHGDVKSTIPLYQNFRDNKQDIFKDANNSSTLNVMALVGDWFMNPSQDGYLSDKTKTSGDYQALFLSKFIEKIKEAVPKLSVLYTPGNHCLDGGDKVFLKNIKDIEMDTVISNSHLEEATLIKELPIEQREKIKEFKILEVKDDKDPTFKHKVLAIGILPINIDFLVKEDISGLGLFGTSSVKEADLREKDALVACEALKKIVDNFKKENPKGAVMLMSHSGEPISKAISRNIPEIDLVLNAHDHQDKISYVGHDDGSITKIVSLSQNAHKIEGVKIHFDDDGNIDISSKRCYTDFEKKAFSNPLDIFYKKTFEKDLAPVFSLKDPLGRPKISVDDIRYENNDLANFCTDSIFTQVNKEYPHITVLGIPSTAFREDMPTSDTRAIMNMDIIDLMKGIAGDLSKIMIGQMSGKTLGSFIYENVVDNLASPSRNALNQFSGIVINKAAIQQAVESGIKIDRKDPAEIYKYIKIRTGDGTFEELNPEKDYEIALPKKLFVKSTNKEFKEAGKDFYNTEKMVSDYFKDFVADCPSEIPLQLDYRIIT